MKRISGAASVLFAGLSVALAPASATAQDGAPFFKERPLSLVVGYGTGGGYDVYARHLARHMGRFLPGSPTIVVQNMPGAGSLTAANFIYNSAPKDGSTFGTFAREMPLSALLKANLVFDKSTLDRWIEKPSAVVPGNAMAFAGVPAAEDRAALINYIEKESVKR